MFSSKNSMRKLLLITFLFVLSNATYSVAQDQQRQHWLRRKGAGVENVTDTIHNSKVYIVSGSLGFGFPVGRTSEVLTTRLASSWGIDVSLSNRHYFLYPTIDFWRFGYDQQYLEENSAYLVKDARAQFVNVNLPVGVRRQFRYLNTYVLAGPTAGLFSEPRAELEPNSTIIRNRFDNRFLFGTRVSFGADYKFRGFFLYLDAGWMHSFAKVQDRPLNIISVYVGVKTDITGVASRVMTILDGDQN